MEQTPKHIIGPRWLVLTLSVLLLLSACSSDKEFGSEDLTKFTPQKGGGALGRESKNPTPTERPGGEKSQQPTQAPKTTQPKEQRFFDVGLVADSPYFEPGNQLVMSRNVTLRVTNKDRTPERPTRSFTAEDGSFDSGALKPGGVWTHTFTRAGTWRIVDPNAPFIFATIELK